MLILILFLLLVAFVATVVGAVVLLRLPLRPRRTVIVQTTGDYAVRGVLHARGLRTVTIRDAAVQVAGSGPAPHPVDGELVIDRDQILWVQALS